MLNTFSYHLTPGGFIFDTSARALGCAVIPAGPGNTEQQFELIEAYRPVGYSGTPDFLKILLDAAAAAKKKARVHLKIDTGMARLGVRPKDLPAFADAAEHRRAYLQHLGERLAPPRGIIFDRNGRVIVDNRAAFDVVLLSMTRSNRAWRPGGISPISSKKTVPPDALSRRPSFAATAPVNARDASHVSLSFQTSM